MAKPVTHRQQVDFNADLIRRYDVAGPRYTSYPTAPHFHEGFDEQWYRENVRDSNGDLLPRPLSLYFHLPFCARICFYCACNKIITANRSRADEYVDYLIRELYMHAELFDDDRRVRQIHWGGGTPTFLKPESMQQLMEATRRAFPIVPDEAGEFSIEVDPREASVETISLLRELGFNRLSIGIQDFDTYVQYAVNRVQSHEQTAEIVHAARRHGFRSVSFDLIYGLPRQSVDSFGKTLEQALALSPDRLVVFNYAHLPQLFKNQRHIDTAMLPPPEQKLEILRQAVDQITAAGYIYIGMDHFAKPDDELAVAQRKGLLQRNFQGYSTHGDCDLVAMGITAIGMVGDSYSQNVRDLSEYYDRIDRGSIPIFRGLKLRAEDRLRRDIIMSLICNFRLGLVTLEKRYHINFAEYFSEELLQLSVLRDDGLLEIDEDEIRITSAGRLLIRNICMIFDAYARQRSDGMFSRTI